MISASDDRDETKILWTMAYIIDEAAGPTTWSYHHTGDEAKKVIVLPERTHDLVFNDTILDSVKDAWETILGERSAEYDFLRFEERKDLNEDE